MSSVAYLLYGTAMEGMPAGLDIALWAGLRELHQALSPERRREFVKLVVLMLVGAVSELATIGSIIPFLALLAGPGLDHGAALPRTLLRLLNEVGAGTLGGAALLFAFIAVIAGIIRVQLARSTQDFIYHVAHELALGMQRRILSQPYSFHISRHSSTLITATDKVEVLVFDLLLPLLQMLTALVIGSFLLLGLLIVSPLATFIALAGFVLIYGAVYALTSGRRRNNSLVIGQAYHDRLKVEQESLGGIRDVIIDHSQSLHLHRFDMINARLARARATTNFMSQAPRFVVESAGMIIVAAIALMLADRPGGITAALPFLGALAVGAQRLLPLAQNVYAGWSLTTAHRSIVGQVVEFARLPIGQETETAGPPTFAERIRFQNVSFCYPSRPKAPALQEIDLDIQRGSMIALTGETGSGKTTLADLLMGLIQPTAGDIMVDDVAIDDRNASAWQRNIGHVAQSVFLADATISANVALSRSNDPVDGARVRDSLRVAQLDQFVDSLPDGEDTVVGERGVRLSGGQRQRIGIARAVYKDARLLVLDEATSALDDATEQAVIGALKQLREEGRTIVIIAHRGSTIAACDRVIHLHGGRIVETR